MLHGSSGPRALLRSSLSALHRQRCAASSSEHAAELSARNRLTSKYGRERVDARLLPTRLSRPAAVKYRYEWYGTPEYVQPQDHPLFVGRDFHYVQPERAQPLASSKSELEYKLTQRRLAVSVVNESIVIGGSGCRRRSWPDWRRSPNTNSAIKRTSINSECSTTNTNERGRKRRAIAVPVISYEAL